MHGTYDEVCYVRGHTFLPVGQFYSGCRHGVLSLTLASSFCGCAMDAVRLYLLSLAVALLSMASVMRVHACSMSGRTDSEVEINEGCHIDHSFLPKVQTVFV